MRSELKKKYNRLGIVLSYGTIDLLPIFNGFCPKGARRCPSQISAKKPNFVAAAKYVGGILTGPGISSVQDPLVVADLDTSVSAAARPMHDPF